MAEVDLFIAGRSYRVACRDGEEDSLRKAAALVDAKSREALAGLGTLSEARQLLFASLLLADEMVDGGRAAPEPPPAPTLDPALAERAERVAERLESLAQALEAEGSRT
jgi:cell division protein ZapA